MADKLLRTPEPNISTPVSSAVASAASSPVAADGTTLVEGVPSAAKLTTGSVDQHLIRMSVPMLAGIAATMAFNLADTVFVSRLGTEPLAALSFAFPVIMVLISVGIGLGAGAASVVARAIGGESQRSIQRLSTDSMILTTIAVVVCSTVGFLTIDPLFRALGATDDVMPMIREYMTIWYAGIGLMIVPMVGLSAVRATGNAKGPGLVMIAAAIANVILDPIFIFGYAGMPALGLAGAAWATVISRAGMLVAALWAMRREDLLSFEIPSWAEFSRSAKRILKIGIPAAATNMIVPASTAVVQPMLAVYGTAAVAAFGAASRVESMALIFFYALSSVIGPVVGQNAGAGLWSRVVTALRSSFLFCMGFGLLAALLLALLRNPVAAIFSKDPEVLRMTALYLLIVPVSYGTYGVVMQVNAVFNALDRPMRAVLVSTVRMVALYLPLAWLGSRLYGVGGIFAGAALANLVTGAVGWWWSNRSVKA